LGDEVERSTPAEIEFEPWHAHPVCVDQDKNKEQSHGYTDGSRRAAAAFGWTLLRSNSKKKQHEVAWNKDFPGEFETAFDGEAEEISDIVE
jgi:hypothetical protein